MDNNERLYNSLRGFLQAPEENVTSAENLISYQVPFYRPSTTIHIRTIEICGFEDEDKFHDKMHVFDVELGREPNTSAFGFNEGSHHKVPFYRPVCWIDDYSRAFIGRRRKSVKLGPRRTTYHGTKVCDVHRPIYHRFSRTSPQSLLLLSCRMGVKTEDGSTICSVCGRDHLR